MKASLHLVSTQGALLRSLASALTVPYFHNAVSDADAILDALVSNEPQNAICAGPGLP